MSLARSVQLRSISDILEEYDNKELACWAIYEGKYPITTYDGDDASEGRNELERLLRKWEKNRTGAIYTFVIYKNAESQAVAARFNFRFENLDIQDYRHTMNGYNPMYNEMKNEIEALKMQIKEMKREQEDDEDDEEEDESGFMGQIGRLLENPTIKDFLSGIFKKQDMQPGKLSGVGNDDEKINQAIVVLKQADRNLADNLTKLAGIAQNEPMVYNMLITKLNAII